MTKRYSKTFNPRKMKKIVKGSHDPAAAAREEAVNDIKTEFRIQRTISAAIAREMEKGEKK